MPPPGGFGTINVERTLPRTFIKNHWTAAVLLVWTWLGAKYAAKGMLQIGTYKAEITEHYIAVEPFLVAERERRFLQHMRNQRDFERELMKDVPGWKVGTLYGEKIYKTLPQGALPPYNHLEFTNFQRRGYWRDRADPSFDL